MQPVEYSMYSLISKESQDSNQLGQISLKWFIWFLSMAHDNFLRCCREPRAQLIIEASCSGQSCHSIASSVNKWHTWVTECQRESWCPDIPEDNFRWSWQTDKHWRSDPTPFLLWALSTIADPPLSGHHCCPHPLLLTSSIVCTLTPLLLPDSHTVLCWSCVPHHNQPLSCLSTAFVCGGKHLRNVLWLRRPWNHRCSLCGLAYSELVLCMRNDTLTLQLDMNEEPPWL